MTIEDGFQFGMGVIWAIVLGWMLFGDDVKRAVRGWLWSLVR